MLKERLLKIRKTLRKDVTSLLSETGIPETERALDVVCKSNDLMVEFAEVVMKESLNFIGCETLPCHFEAVGIGSLARGEATPYSDIEYLFLIEDMRHRKYFERLAVMTYFLIGGLNETKLNSLAISELIGDDSKAIESGWYVDGRKLGYQIDEITSTSDNVPTRATSSEATGGFIVTPNELIRDYAAVLKSSNDKESIRGGVTSILTFTRLLYSSPFQRDQHSHDQSNCEGTLLGKFSDARASLSKKKSRDRIAANFRMLSADIAKFGFHPSMIHMPLDFQCT